MRARLKAAEYRARADAWYGRKRQAIAVLARTPLASVRFYVPENPHRYHVDLCPRHLDEFHEERSYGMCERVMEYFFQNQALIEKCGGCSVDVEKHYYSLYYVQIQSVGAGDADRFSFHLPCEAGRKFLPPIHEAVRVDHSSDEGWGTFRFGRATSDEESVAYSEKFVDSRLDAALRTVTGYLAVPAAVAGSGTAG